MGETVNASTLWVYSVCSIINYSFDKVDYYGVLFFNRQGKLISVTNLDSSCLTNRRQEQTKNANLEFCLDA
jgi:hypothetical protein